MSFVERTGDAVIDRPAIPVGLATLAKSAFSGADMQPLWEQSVARVAADPRDMAAMMDLATIAQLCGQRENGLSLQAQALQQARLYRRPGKSVGAHPVRLLALMAPGDFMAN